MSNIQDILALEQHIYDIVQDYVDGNHNEKDVLGISHRHGEIILEADSQETIVTGKSTEIHPLKALLRIGEDGRIEPDIDKISDLANTWLFLE